MNRYIRLVAFVSISVFMLCGVSSLAEMPAGDAEQGLEEIQPLLEMTEVTEEKEGVGLEEMTEAVTESVMSEYLDSTTGFSMQYPSIFQFDEELPGNIDFGDLTIRQSR